MFLSVKIFEKLNYSNLQCNKYFFRSPVFRMAALALLEISAECEAV